MDQTEFPFEDPRQAVRRYRRPVEKSEPLQVSGISLAPLDEFPGTAIRASAFRGFVGMTCFCPMCQGVIDCCHATGIDVLAAPQGKILKTMIFCDQCFESKVAARVPVALLAARKTHPDAIAIIEQGKRYHEKGLL